MRISDLSSDVCSSDLQRAVAILVDGPGTADSAAIGDRAGASADQCGIIDDVPGQAAAGAVDAHLQAPAVDGGGAGKGVVARTEARRVGKTCVSTCRSGG